MIEITSEGVYRFLQDLDIDAEIIDDDHVAALLGEDGRGRDVFLHVRIVETDLTEAIGASSDDANTYHLLQFYVPLPFEVSDGGVVNAARQLFYINRMLELSGFEMSEPDKLIYFRYALPVANGYLEEAVLTSIIGTIEDTVNAFSPQIEETAVPQ
jgi:hypothetical protein